MSLRILPSARRDIISAIDWYEEQREGLGRSFALHLEATLENVERMPQIYTHVHPLVQRALVSRYPYAVFYSINRDQPVVIAVLHTRRDADRWRERL